MIAAIGATEPAPAMPRWPEIEPAQRNEEAFELKFAIQLEQKPRSVGKFLAEEMKRRPEPEVKAQTAWVCFWGPMYGVSEMPEYSRGIALAREAAAAGSVAGQELLGEALVLGLGVEVDLDGGIRQLREAAQRGSMRALAQLGRLELAGRGMPRNEEEGQRKLRRAAQLSGDMRQYRLLARAYISGREGLPRDLGKAVDCIYRVAIYGTNYVEREFDWLEQQGAPNVPLYRALAIVHDANENVWVTKARVQKEVKTLEQLGGNLAAAQYELGTIYGSNRWVTHDYKKALDCLARARGLGEDRANYTLARMRLVGRGMAREEAAALSDLQLLAADGDEHAAALLGALYYWGTEDASALKKDPAQAYAYSRQGAENGSVTGILNLARCYEEGIGVKRDYLVAGKLYWIAACRGAFHADEAAIRLSHFIEKP